MMYGLLHVFSILFLSLDMVIVLSLNDGDTAGEVFRLTLRRWAKLLAAFFLLGLIVQIMSL